MLTQAQKEVRQKQKVHAALVLKLTKQARATAGDACEVCGKEIEADRLALRRYVEKYVGEDFDFDGVRMVGPTTCHACGADAEPTTQEGREKARLLVPRESVLLAPVRTTVDDNRIDRRTRKITGLTGQVVRPVQIPGDAEPQSSLLGHLRGRVKPDGSRKLQNPWDRKPRDRGRRDFESPTEEKALGKDHEPVDPIAPSQVYASGSI